MEGILPPEMPSGRETIERRRERPVFITYNHNIPSTQKTFSNAKETAMLKSALLLTVAILISSGLSHLHANDNAEPKPVTDLSEMKWVLGKWKIESTNKLPGFGPLGEKVTIDVRVSPSPR